MEVLEKGEEGDFINAFCFKTWCIGADKATGTVGRAPLREYLPRIVGGIMYL